MVKYASDAELVEFLKFIQSLIIFNSPQNVQPQRTTFIQTPVTQVTTNIVNTPTVTTTNSNISSSSNISTAPDFSQRYE
jgi:hypothetical protein